MRKTTTVLKYILTLIGLITFYNISMYLVCKIPSDMLYDNVLESAHILKDQDSFYSKAFFSFIENSVDSLIINEAYSVDSNNPLESYILVRKNYKYGLTKVQLKDQSGQLNTYGDNKYSGETVEPDIDFDAQKELLNFLLNKVEISRDYARYYHGYLVLYRPLLLVFNITKIRILMTIILSILLGGMAFLLNKIIGIRTMAIYIVTIIVYGFFSVSQTIEEAPLYLVMLLSTIYLLSNIEKFNKEKMMFLLFIVGSLVAFVDFLTTPALTIFLPISILYVYNNKNDNKFQLLHENMKDTFLDVFMFGFIWLLGYATTIVSKFIIADCLCSTSIVNSGIKQALFRISGEVSVISMDFMLRILFHIIRTGAISILFVIVVLFLMDSFKFKKINKKVINANKNLLMLSLVPIGWMIILFNHTLYHFDLYPYRNMMGIVLVLLLLITEDKNAEKGNVNKNERRFKKNN